MTKDSIQKLQCIVCKKVFLADPDSPSKQNCPDCMSWHTVNLTRGEIITEERVISLHKFLMKYSIHEDKLLDGIPESHLNAHQIYLCKNCKEKGVTTFCTDNICYKCGHGRKEMKDGYHQTPEHRVSDGTTGLRENSPVHATG